MSENEKLKSGFSNSQLFDKGLQLTDEIKQLGEQNLNLHEEIALCDRKIREYQDHAAEKIAKALDNNGKKEYTNETSRATARRALLRDWSEYNQSIDSLSSMKHLIKHNDIEIKYRVYRLRLINSYIQQTLE